MSKKSKKYRNERTGEIPSSVILAPIALASAGGAAFVSSNLPYPLNVIGTGIGVAVPAAMWYKSRKIDKVVR